ncbi:MAG: UPF0147 family protein [archaeon]
MNQLIQEICETFEDIACSDGVPRNIKDCAKNISTIVGNDSETLSSRKERALTLLTGMINDPNIDTPTQMSLYNAMSVVESLDL